MKINTIFFLIQLARYDQTDQLDLINDLANPPTKISAHIFGLSRVSQCMLIKTYPGSV